MRLALSFRTKIALLAGCVTGGILLAACGLLWNLTYRFNLESLDRDVRQLAEANLHRVQGRAHWARLEESLSFVTDEDTMMYRIWVRQLGRQEVVSAKWPEGVNPEPFFFDWESRRDATDAPKLPERGNPISDSNPALPMISATFHDFESEGNRWRVGVFDNYYANLAIAVDIASFEARMGELKLGYYLVAPASLFFAFVCAWFVATRSLRPVDRLTGAVEGLAAHGLDQRLEKAGYEVEFQKLIAMFNEMMERLEKAFRQAGRFSADASHELKTPLARVQMELEAALGEAPSESLEQVRYSNLLDEVSRLNGIVEKLTLLSSSDAGKLQLNFIRTNASELVLSVSEDYEMLADGRAIEVAVAPEVWIESDPILFEQCLQNLASNAVKYGKAGTEIRFDLSKNNGRARFSISNRGVPIPDEDKVRIFDRFFRLDESRTAEVGGAGLGLSLSREIARAHGGDIWVESTEVWDTVFVLEIPAVS